MAIVTSEEAISHLRGENVFIDQAELDRLEGFIASASAACESYSRRPLDLHTYTETLDGPACGPLLLRRGPVVDIISITEGGVSVAPSAYDLDADAGLVYRGTSAGPLNWSGGRRNVVVTYRAGWLTPPADVKLAVLREVEHLWQRTQNAPHPGMGGDQYDEMLRETTSALPWPVRHLLDRYRSVGGFA